MPTDPTRPPKPPAVSFDVAPVRRKPGGFAPGSVLGGNFRLEFQLGRGGMGEAWKAYDLTADRFVVLKFVPKEIQHVQEAMEGVRDSFRKVHELQHQHVCPVYGLFTDPQHGYYLVMKYIDGIPLDEYKRKQAEKRGRMPSADAIQILWAIAKGLDYAHGMKVIHRDIKPQNIMIGKKEGVQIIDFGLAEEIRTSMTRFSEVEMSTAGTRPYMAPEQWRGRLQDARTDQYALAVTAYELLAGHPPFMGSDAGVLRECVLHDEPEPIPGYPAYINEALRKALAKKREDRFPDCKSFVKALATKPAEAESEPYISEIDRLLGLLPSDQETGKTVPPAWLPSSRTNSSLIPAHFDFQNKKGWMIGVAVGCVLLFGLLGLFLARSPSRPNLVAMTVAPPQNLSTLSNDEKRMLQEKYSELDWTDANIIVLPTPSENGLRQALAQAAETKANDFIVVRTTKENRRVVLSGDPLKIEHNAAEKGGVALIALGPEKLVLDGGRKDRIFTVRDGAHADFAGVVFTNGQVVDEHGGAVSIDKNSTGRFFHCDFIDNACIPVEKHRWHSPFGGGGIGCREDCTLVLRDVLFERNRNNDPDIFEESKKEGTTLYTDSSAGVLAINSSIFATNVVLRNNCGGGMYLHNMKAAELQNISLLNNKSTGHGAIHLYGSDDEQTYKIVNLFAVGNASGQFGGALQIGGRGRIILDHLTLVDNSSSQQGGGLCVGGGGGEERLNAKEVTLSNSIIAGNHGNIPDIIINTTTHNNTVGKLNVFNNIIHNQAYNQNNLSLALQDLKLGELKDFGNGIPVMPLLAGSPAIDAGVATETTPQTDITGRPRNVGKAPDIGAFEFQ